MCKPLKPSIFANKHLYTLCDHCTGLFPVRTLKSHVRLAHKDKADRPRTKKKRHRNLFTITKFTSQTANSKVRKSGRNIQSKDKCVQTDAFSVDHTAVDAATPADKDDVNSMTAIQVIKSEPLDIQRIGSSIRPLSVVSSSISKTSVRSDRASSNTFIDPLIVTGKRIRKQRIVISDSDSDPEADDGILCDAESSSPVADESHTSLPLWGEPLIDWEADWLQKRMNAVGLKPRKYRKREPRTKEIRPKEEPKKKVGRPRKEPKPTKEPRKRAEKEPPGIEPPCVSLDKDFPEVPTLFGTVLLAAKKERGDDKKGKFERVTMCSPNAMDRDSTDVLMLRAHIKDTTQMNEWIDELSSKSISDWHLVVSKPGDHSRFKYYRQYYCRYANNAKLRKMLSNKVKCLDCGAKVFFGLTHQGECTIKFYVRHSHEIGERDPNRGGWTRNHTYGKEVLNAFHALFEQGMVVGQAYKKYKKTLQQRPDFKAAMLNDHTVMPKYSQVIYMYNKYIRDVANDKRKHADAIRDVAYNPELEDETLVSCEPQVVDADLTL